MIAAESEGMVKDTLVFELPEGRVELLKFANDWQKIGSAGAG